MSQLNLTRPLRSATSGRTVYFVGQRRDGHLVFEREGNSVYMTTDSFGRSRSTGNQRVVNAPIETKRVISVYPNGAVYENPQPVRSSIHGVENLIQIEVTEVEGRIVSKRFV